MVTVVARAILLLGITVVVARPSVSQPVAPYWDTGFGVPGLNGGGVGDIERVGDRILFAGFFSVAGTTSVNNIAFYDPESNAWTPLGSGVDGSVQAVAPDEEGRIFVGGTFSHAGGVPASNVAMWDGVHWHALGEGLVGTVYDLVLHNGVLYAVGDFDSEGMWGIAAWDGAGWHLVGGGLSEDGYAARGSTIEVGSEGHLYVGGRFDRAGETPATSFAIWNGSEWRAPELQLNSTERFGVVVYTIARAGEDLIVGGRFTHAGSEEVHHIARYRAGNWYTIGGGLPGATVADLDTFPNGDLVVVGTLDRAPDYLFATFRNDTWSFIEPVGPQRMGTVVETIDDDNVLVGHIGLLTPEGGNPSQFLLQWNRQAGAWSVVDREAKGVDGPIYALLPSADGGFYAAGDFTFAGQTRANNIAYWNGAEWEALGDGIDGVVYALAMAPNGDVFAGGQFYESGNLAVRHVARWGGASWYALGEGISLPAAPALEAVYSLSIHEDELVVGGRFSHAGTVVSANLARWDFQDGQWREAIGAPNGPVMAMWSDGDQLVIGGPFSEIAPAGSFSHLARWVDGAWLPMGEGSSIPVEVLGGRDGSLFAVGEFNGSDLARWTGSAWEPTGVRAPSGAIRALSVLNDGQMFIAGDFTELQQQDGTRIAANRIAYFDPFVGGRGDVEPLFGGGIGQRTIYALAQVSEDLAVGGEFGAVGAAAHETDSYGIPSMNIAVYRGAVRTSLEPAPEVPSEVQAIHVYPNLSSGSVTLNLSLALASRFEVTVYDLLGRVVYKGENMSAADGNGSLQIPGSSFAIGVYLVRVSTPTEAIFTSFTITN